MMKALQGYDYCPRCGFSVVFSSSGHVYCEHCKHTTYINVSTAVWCYLYDDEGAILLSQRARNPWKGKHDDPGGFMDRQDTSCEETLIREIREELSIDISDKQFHYLDSIRMLYAYKWREVPVCAIHFVVYCDSVSKQSIVVGDDVASITWISLQTFDPTMMCLPVQAESVYRAFDVVKKLM